MTNFCNSVFQLETHNIRDIIIYSLFPVEGLKSWQTQGQGEDKVPGTKWGMGKVICYPVAVGDSDSWSVPAVSSHTRRPTFTAAIGLDTALLLSTWMEITTSKLHLSIYETPYSIPYHMGVFFPSKAKPFPLI